MISKLFLYSNAFKAKTYAQIPLFTAWCHMHDGQTTNSAVLVAVAAGEIRAPQTRLGDRGLWARSFNWKTFRGILKLCKFCKNRARDTPLPGIYIPKFSKIFSFWGLIPLLLHRWWWNLAGRNRPKVCINLRSTPPYPTWVGGLA